MNYAALGLCIFAYLIGSLSSAIIICKIRDLPDPRTQGSKNAGATNVLRMASKRIAIAVLLGDMLKGLIPVLLGHLIGLKGAGLGYIALFAILGHIYPVFFRFKGGKGVATALGSFFGLSFMLGVFVLAVWLIMLAIYRYASLSSITAVAVAPILAAGYTDPRYLAPLLIIFFVVTLKHWKNIKRLANGEEPKVKLKSEKAAEPESEPSDKVND